jgi:CRP-like cAMP-binding protein
MRFSPENTWAMDHESYNNQTPSRSNIEALEDSEVMIWTKAHFEQLFEAYPAFKEFSDRLKASTFDANQERILMNISYTSEEKYEAFVAMFPDILRRVPLHMVASYLGVSRETLSRIRHARVGKKA